MREDSEFENDSEKHAYHITRKLFWLLTIGAIAYCGAMAFVLATTKGNM
ncbi:MAG: hypothetical protein AAGB46_17805 [Verrucomicrobiota bacterium]